MNTLKTAVFIIFSFLIVACSGSRTVTTPATDRSLTVDGNLTGWDLEQSVVERSDAVNYYATHDNEFLYLYVDVRSRAKNYAMRQSGFIIYLSSNEENRKQVGIAFPSGSFNLLREDPGAYNSFLNDQEWGQNPRNMELLQNLEGEIFDRIMIVERSGSSERNHGFINKDQLLIDGIEIAAEDGRRLMGIEMRVPLNEASLYNLNGNKIWLGFEIDPPNIRIQDDQSSMNQQQRYGGQRRVNQNRGNRQSNLRQRMGQYERWYQLNLSQ
ncbi:hypothetical protein BH23BAC3_BH23BAC3_25980 [soil metagenome]